MTPKHTNRRLSLLRLSIGLAALGLGAVTVVAHPYASGITNSSGTISFILNEGADSVKVAFDNNTVTNNLGALVKGAHSFALGPHTNYSIIVFKVGSGTISMISSDTNVFVNFGNPRGVAVNSNPQNRNFGRIYVSNAGTGSTSAGPHSAARTGLGRGIYIMNADQSDALGRGNTTSTAGLAFVGSSYSPWRLFVGRDGLLYVASTSTLANGGFLGVTDPDVTGGLLALTGYGIDGAPGPNHSDIMGTPVAYGSTNTGDLVISTMDVGWSPGQSIQQWNVGAGPFPSGVAPVTMAQSGEGDIFNLSDSYYTPTNQYILLSRNSSTWPYFDALQVFDHNNNLLWSSWSNSVAQTPGVVTNDLFARGIGMIISPDTRLVATMRLDDSGSIVCYLTNGIPDESTLFTNLGPTSVGASYGSVCFDAAENLYSVSSGTSLLRVFSLGLTTTAITHNDWTTTNGTFQFIAPSASVGVVATTPNASQNHGSPIPAVFTISRHGGPNIDLNVPITFGGTAAAGTYTVAPSSATNGSIVIPAGQNSVTVTITPVNDNVSRPTTTVILTLGSTTDFSPMLPGYATAYIQNTGPQQLMLSGVNVATMYKRFTNDYVSFVITRWGDTNAAAYSVNSFTYGGTATPNTDFRPVAPFTINPGDLTDTVTISNIANTSTTYTGNKNIVVGLNSAAGYTATTDTQTMTIIDSAYPSATVLFSDPLTSVDDATNWNITALVGDSTLPPDYNADFGYDLTSGGPFGLYGIIPLPPNGATTALRVTANKNNGGQAAAVNLYLTNTTFSGNYAVRFNMYLVQGSSLANSAEGPMFGINHDGLQTNWWYSSGTLTGGPWSSDGVWYWLCAWAAAYGSDYMEFTGVTNAIPNTGWQRPATDTYASFMNQLKDPNIFTSVNTSSNAVPGLPSNASPFVLANSGNWADVEIKQVNNVVTLSIDKTQIFSMVNTNSLFKAGYLMLGYEVPNAENAGLDAAVYFSNLQVVRLAAPTAPTITGIHLVGNNVSIDFTSTDSSDTTASFGVQSATLVNGSYADVSPAASITQNSTTHVFTATTAQQGPIRFFRVYHR